MSCLNEPPDDAEWTTTDNIFIKQMFLKKKGILVPQHSHEYDHTSLVASGSVRAWKDGVLLGDFCAPFILNIPARTKHKFLSLEDKTVVYCIHNVSHSGIVDIHEEHKLKGFG